MKICRVILQEVGSVLAAVGEDEQVRVLRLPLQEGQREVVDVVSWDLLLTSAGDRPLAAYVAEISEGAEALGSFADLVAQGRVLTPLDRQEVWAAGVTYWRSRQARMEESDTASKIYDLVYDAERPELFFKATPHRVVGPGGEIAVRQDSKWSVPEPELAVLLDNKLNFIGFTVCNDVSSRDIEGANPLYLPQAKVYDACCAVGPAVLLVDSLPEKPELRMECTIKRDGLEVFHGGASTAQLKRTLPELIGYLGRSNSFPEGVLLSTGTSIVPPDDFTLQAGDLVEIEIEGVGILANPVKVV
ncbi:MAG: fumarylacetoacetate hydrolase family protein [Chloroflexi bacterium]|nr:fumarylacetoacetate hydrolase family protein [Chloroflexota bacterium]